MPVVAVIPAVFAGVQIATVGIAAMTTLQVVAAVGAIVGGVGAITGNKSLMKIGAVAGLVGGIGSFAQGQGWMTGAAGADANAMANAAANATPEISNTSQMIAEAAPGIVDPTAGLATTADAGASSAIGAATESATAGAAGASGAPTTVGDGGGGGGLMSKYAGASSSPSAANYVNSLDMGVSTGQAAASGGSSIFDTLKGVGDFMSKNKDLTSMGLKFVGGLFDEKADAEGDYLQSGIELNMARTAGINAQTDIMKQQAANGNAVPDITNLRTKTGSVYNTAPPPIYQAPKAGLINSTGR